MKEYIVSEIKCKKTLNITDIYNYVKCKVKFNSNFFAFQDINFNNISEECKKIYNRLNLDKYAYRKVLEHLTKTSYYNSERDDRRMISNMDFRWNWYNENVNTILNDKELVELIRFCDMLRSTDVSTMLLVFDEIEWNCIGVGQGTYGYSKADCTYLLGKNYLSNSVTIGKTYGNSTYTVYISCEKSFCELNIIKEMMEFLGQKSAEEVYFAPECESERKEWELIYSNADRNFKKAISGLQTLTLQNIDKIKFAENKKINIKQYIKKYLCTDGWEIRKALSDERPIIVHKIKGDTDICMAIISGHNGHHLQVLFYYRSKKFAFSKNIDALFYNEISESDMETYFYNVQKIRNYLYNAL